MIRRGFPDERAADAWAMSLIQRVQSAPSVDAAIAVLTQDVGAKVDPYALGVFLHDERGELVLKHTVAHGALAAQPVRVPPNQGMVGFVCENRVPLHVPNVDRDPRYIRGHLVEAKSALAVPILAGRRSYGAIDVEEDHPDAFDALDLRVFEALGRALGTVFASAPRPVPSPAPPP